jgi:iron(III) transport system permease protein
LPKNLEDINLLLLSLFLLVFVTPILFIFFNIFNDSNETWIHIQNYLLHDYIVNSLIIVVAVAFITIILGTSLAWIISMYNFPGVNLFRWLLILPMAIPAYVNAYIYAGINETSGILFNFFELYFDSGASVYDLYDIRNIYGAILILSISLYPYIYLLCLPALSNHSSTVFEVGQSMGLNRLQRLTKIGIPIIRPAVIAGVSFVIMETLAEYATVQYFGVPTFATGIFRAWFVLGDETSSFFLSSILLTLIFLLVYFEQLSRGKKRFANPTNNIKPIKIENISRKVRYSLSAYCSVILVLGFLIPVLQLIYWISYSFEEINFIFILSLLNSSAIIALISSILILFFTINVAYLIRSNKNLFNNFLSKTLSVGYAIPGVVLAVAVIGPVSILENSLPSIFGFEPKTILTGTFYLLIVAYLIRFSTISLKTLDSGLNKISNNYDHLASSFGLNKFQTLFKVHLPILLPTIYTAMILVFVDIVKELPITLILRPFNFNTLPVHLYELAESENLSSMGMPGLILIIICLIPVIILSRGIMNNESK